MSGEIIDAGRVHTDECGLEVLSWDQCLRCLDGATIGRVGFHSAALPVVLPVVFALDHGSIVMRTRQGSQLHTATRDAVVAFEADDVDLERGTGWSVALTGRARHVTHPDELARARSLFLSGWDGAGCDRYVRISLEALTGRRGRIAVAGPEARRSTDRVAGGAGSST